MTIRANEEHDMWCEKFRPQTIEECVLPTRIKQFFTDIVQKQDIPTLLLDGTAGVGKTTVAKALCNEIGAEYLFINGSEEGRNIDILRTSVRGFASSVSMYDQPKVIIFDEFDFTNAQSVQPALRGMIEEYSKNCRFIFTCNYKNKILEPILSRCTVIDFRLDKTDKIEMAGQFYKRAIQILNHENIEYDAKVVAEVIKKYFPDYRKILMELQRYSSSGRIDTGILVNLSDESYKELYKLMKEKDWRGVRTWIGKNSDNDMGNLINKLDEDATSIFEPTSLPNLISILGEYDYKSAFVANKEINIMCALTEIMGSCQFK